VVCASSYQEAISQMSVHDCPDIILADYHLDEGETGLATVLRFFDYWQQQIPCAIISADPDAFVKESSKAAGFLFLQKPIKPHILRAALSRFASMKKYD